jgi:hypothetical protein
MNPSHFSEALFTLGLELARLECYDTRLGTTPTTPPDGNGKGLDVPADSADGLISQVPMTLRHETNNQSPEPPYEGHMRAAPSQGRSLSSLNALCPPQTAAEASEGLVPKSSNVSAADRVRNEQIVLQALRAWLGGPEWHT